MSQVVGDAAVVHPGLYAGVPINILATVTFHRTEHGTYVIILMRQLPYWTQDLYHNHFSMFVVLVLLDSGMHKIHAVVSMLP